MSPYIVERANASLHELEDVLLGTSTGKKRVETSKAKTQLHATVNPRTLKWYEDNARPQKYKHAVSKLNALLSQDAQVCFTWYLIVSVRQA
jgi:hypothetical protein